MAKDGTLRGGIRVGQTGRPKKSLLEKTDVTNPSKNKIGVLDIPDNLEGADLVGEDMPPVKEYMSAKQRDGKSLEAGEIYINTLQWLKRLNCDKYVNPQLIEQYSMSVARWLQCEEAITKFGFLGKHPTSGAPIQSPYVAMSQSFMKQANVSWLQIFQIVKENCTVDYKGINPQDDLMERLLQARSKGKLPT